jgi:hypothetical protein
MMRNIRVSTRASQYSQQNRDIMTRSYGPRRSLELACQALLFRLPEVHIHILVRSVVLVSKRHFRLCPKWNADLQKKKSTVPTAEHITRRAASRQYVDFFSRTVTAVERQRGQIGNEALLVVVVDVNVGRE